MIDNRTSTCECGKPKPPSIRGCQRCLELDQERYNRADGPRGEILSYLSHVDEASSADVLDACEVAGVQRHRYATALSFAVKSGLVEVRMDRGLRLYRLVQKQRRAAA